jgi:N-acetylmuramoyl-L-alanine amidase
MPSTHTVVQGECLSSIAAKYGFADWKTIYDDPANADFKRLRLNPNVIYPGDQLTIPDKKKKSTSGSTGKKHKFKVKMAKTYLRLKLGVDESHHYVLKVGSSQFDGTTDGSTPIEHPISPKDREGELTLWPASAGQKPPENALVLTLALGELDPVEEVSGVQGVLTCLGYYWGPIDGRQGPEMTEAVKAFQASVGLDPTGVIDDAVRDKLRHEYGA